MVLESWSALVMNLSLYQFFRREFLYGAIYNNCDIRRKKQRERRNPDNMYLNIIQTNCVHKLHLKCFLKIGQSKDTSVKYCSQISCQMIHQSTAYRLGTDDCYKNDEGVEKK